MKSIEKLLAIMAVASSSYLGAQSERTDTKGNPKGVVEDFFKMETNGGRLNREGWQDARKFFLRSNPFKPPFTVLVIKNNYSVWNPMVMPDGTTVVIVEINPVGQIDSTQRFTPPARRYYKNGLPFKLAFSDKRWELETKGEPGKQIAESHPSWLIDEPDDSVTLDVDSAVRYVTEQRDLSHDPIVKRNADETVAKLSNK